MRFRLHRELTPRITLFALLETNMLTNALLVFFIGALGGLVLASFALRGKVAPWVISLLHALLGASGRDLSQF